MVVMILAFSPENPASTKDGPCIFFKLYNVLAQIGFVIALHGTIVVSQSRWHKNAVSMWHGGGVALPLKSG